MCNIDKEMEYVGYLNSFIEAIWNEKQINQNLTYKYADMFLFLNVDINMLNETIKYFMGEEFCEKAYEELELMHKEEME